MRLSALLLPAALLTGACQRHEPVMCTMEARSGITVAVLGADGDSLTVTPTGTLRDGSYEESLQPFGHRLSGAVERKGTYDVAVAAPGYQAWDTTGVVVTADECHVQTVSLDVRLARAE